MEGSGPARCGLQGGCRAWGVPRVCRSPPRRSPEHGPAVLRRAPELSVYDSMLHSAISRQAHCRGAALQHAGRTALSGWPAHTSTPAPQQMSQPRESADQKIYIQKYCLHMFSTMHRSRRSVGGVCRLCRAPPRSTAALPRGCACSTVPWPLSVAHLAQACGSDQPRVPRTPAIFIPTQPRSMASSKCRQTLDGTGPP